MRQEDVCLSPVQCEAWGPFVFVNLDFQDLSDQIQQEDIEICETVQKGLRSRSYNQGRFSAKRENGVHHFQALVHEFLTR